jgi:hypothetical protein
MSALHFRLGKARTSVPKHAANQDFSPDRAEASTARPIKSIGAWMIHLMKTEYLT